MDPGESHARARLTRYASVCALLGEQEQAVSALEKVLVKRPQDAQTRMLLILIVKDPLKRAEYAQGFDVRSLSSIGSFMQQLLHNSNQPVVERLQLIEAITSRLGGEQDLQKLNLQWMAQLAFQLGQHISSSGSHFYPLYYSNGSRTMGASGKLARQRRDVHDGICRTLLRHPDTAEYAFALLAAANEAEAREDIDLEELAKQAFTVSQSSRVPYWQSVNMNVNGRQVLFHKPVEYLLMSAAKTNDQAYINDELLPQVRKSGRKVWVASMEALAAMLTCSEDAFPTQANAYLEASSRFRQHAPNVNGGLARVVSVWRDRGLQMDLQPLLIGQLHEILRTNVNASVPGAFEDYVITRSKQGASVDVLLDALAEAYLGPKERQKEFVRQNFDPRSISSGTPNYRIYQFRQFLQQLANEPDLRWEVFVRAYELGISQNTGIGNNLVQTYFEGDDSERLKKWLPTSPFVKDLDGFEAYNENGRETVWGRALGHLVNPSYRTKLDAVLQGAPHTFGWDLIRAVMAEQNPREAILDHFASHREAIDALTPEKKRDLGILAQETLRRFQGNPSNRPQDQGTESWLASLRQQARPKNKFAESVLQAKRLADLTKAVGSNTNLTTELLGVIETNPKQAKIVFHKLVKLLGPVYGSRNSGFPGYGGGNLPFQMPFFDSNKTLASNLLNGTLFHNHSGSQGGLNRAKFMLDVLYDADPEIELPDHARHRMDQLFSGLRSQVGSGEEAIYKLYDRLGESLPGLPTSLLIPSYYNWMQSVSEKQAIIDWAEKEIQDGKYPEIAKNFLAAAKLVSASQAVHASPERRLPTESTRHYVEILADESLPVTWREEIAITLLERTRQYRVPELVYATATLLRSDKQDIVHSRELMRLALNRLLALPREPDLWLATAAAICKKWNQFLLRPRGKAATLNQRMSQQQDILLLLMVLNVETGREKEFNQLVQRFGQGMSYSSEYMALLVRCEKYGKAEQVLRQKLSNSFSSGVSTSVRYDEALAQKLPKFLETIAAQDERYIAELLLSSLYAPGDHSSEAAKNARSQRIGELVQRFSQITFASTELKQNTVIALIQLDRSCLTQDDPTIRNTVQEMVKELDVLDGVDRQYQNSGVIRQLFSAHVEATLQINHDVQPLFDIIEKVRQTGVEGDQALGQFFRTLLEPMERYMRETGLHDWDPQQQQLLARCYRQIIDASGERSIMYLHNVMSSALVAHVIANEHEAFAQLFASNDDRNDRQTRYLQRIYLGQALPGIINRQRADELSVKRRVELVGSLLHCLHAAGQLRLHDERFPATLEVRNYGDLIRNFENQKLISAKELAAHADELAKADHGYSWALVAMSHEQTSRRGRRRGASQHGQEEKNKQDAEAEQAITAWQKAIAAASEQPELEAKFRKALSNLYNRLQRPEDAKRILATTENG